MQFLQRDTNMTISVDKILTHNNDNILNYWFILFTTNFVYRVERSNDKDQPNEVLIFR